MKPFHLGVGLREVASRSELVEKARKLETLGYDTLLSPDHLSKTIAP